MFESINSIEKFDLREQLKSLRRDWSDEIPQEVIHFNDEDSKYKVRRNWFQQIVTNTWMLLDEGKISNEESKKAAEELIEKFTSEEFVERKLTTSEDIETANHLMDVILGEEN
jgi:uncharacterized protein YaaW (UPF0174 family)